MTTDAATLLGVRAEDTCHREQAAAEVAFWSQPHPFGFEAMEAAREPEGTSSLRIEGGILSTNPSLHVTFLEISPGAVERRAKVLGGRYPSRVATRISDLRFVEFEPARYDLMVSSASLHLVTNLEHLAFQINRTLRPGGRFFLDDYGGEPRFQFSVQKRRAFEVLFNRDLARQSGREPGLCWLDASDLSPFCGVRSDETLDVFATFLTEIQIRTATGLLAPPLRSRPLVYPTGRPGQAVRAKLRALWNRLRGLALRMTIDEPFIRELTLVGDVLSDAGVLLPGTAFAIYGPR